MRKRTLILRGLAALILLVVAAGLIAPRVSADRFRDRVRTALEQSLGRRVEVSNVRFSLFSGPGFTVEDVVIHEASGFGPEPFAHVRELDARLALRTLWTGRMSFSRLRLTEPSVNLMRRSGGGWNVLELMERGSAANPSPSALHLPAIEVRSGRVFFKTDTLKSPYYLTNADVDLGPRDGGRSGFDIRLTVEPARTDRTAQGFATISARGRWSVAAGREGTLDLEVDLERTPVQQIVRLVRGQSLGVDGFVVSRAQIKGPLSQLSYSGRLRAENVRRWDLVGRGGSLRFAYSGTVNWRTGQAAFAISERLNPGLPFLLDASVEDLRGVPRWRVALGLRRLEAGGLLDAARHLGAALPPQLRVTGSISGDSEWNSQSGWSGSATLSGGSVGVAGGDLLQVADTAIAFAADEVQFGPAALRGEPQQAADVSATWNTRTGAVSADVRAAAMNITELESGAGHLLRAAGIPLIDRLQRGVWSGALRFAAGPGIETAWRGEIQLRDALTALPGIAGPVSVRSAAVIVDGPALHIGALQLEAASVALSGEYSYDPAAQPPHRFALATATLRPGQAEALLAPALVRQPGFLTRTLRFGSSPVPEWLAERQAAGTITVGTLHLFDTEIRSLRADVLWAGPLIRVTVREGQLLDGRLKGTMTADLTGAAPVYHAEGGVENLRWRTGRATLSGTIDSAGAGPQAAASLRAAGDFELRGASLIAGETVRQASGSFEWTAAGGRPQLSLSKVTANIGRESFTGSGRTENGELQLQLESPGRTLRLAGPMSPLRLQPASR